MKNRPIFCLALATVLSCATAFSQTKIACIGDSITAGVGTKTPKSDSYPMQLQALLGDAYEVMNLGASSRTLLDGHRSAWRLGGGMKRIATFNPDVATIKLGTNDSKGKHWKDKARFTDDLNALIDDLLKINPNMQIHLCLPAPAYHRRTWKLSPFKPLDPDPKKANIPSNGNGISGVIIRDEIIPMIKRVAAARKLKTIDLNTVLREAKQEPKELLPDGVHPSNAGARIIAETIAQHLQGR